jgi:hypothetical protein
MAYARPRLCKLLPSPNMDFPNLIEPRDGCLRPASLPRSIQQVVFIHHQHIMNWETRANHRSAVIESVAESLAAVLKSKHKLDQVPLEIIRRIVVSGPCENALVLCCVNRKLREICYDPLLFKDIVGNGNGSNHPESTSWWNTAVGTTDEKASVAARWALADSRANAANFEMPPSTGNIKKTLDWLVPLLIVGRKSLLCQCSQLLKLQRSRKSKVGSDVGAPTSLSSRVADREPGYGRFLLCLPDDAILCMESARTQRHAA